MVTRTDITEALERAGVAYSVVEHPPALTTQEADAYIEGYDGVRTKSLFIVNKKRTASYLLVMDDAKPLDLVALATVLGETRLSLGSPERLVETLGLAPGVVSPFAFLDEDRRATHLLWDAEMLREPILTFHPSDNTATIFVGTQDLLDLLTSLGVKHRTIDAPTGDRLSSPA